MEFRTCVEIEKSAAELNHEQPILLMGSCFAENIGNKLAESKFHVDINPFGVLYNPLSISDSLYRLIEGKPYEESDLFEKYGSWHSFAHHSKFSDPDKSVCLQNINKRLEYSSKALRQTDRLIITFGTSYVYFLPENRVVANCHKLPEKNFNRRLISVQEILSVWEPLIAALRKIRPSLKIIFTVSPIRHFKDGAHANQLSKSTLLLAINELCDKIEGLDYFPSYELVMDELRDYRFYATDMIHLSDVAVDYIWRRFSETYFSLNTREICKSWLDITKLLNHRPLSPDSNAYKDFVMQNLFKLKKIKEKYPFFDIENEIAEEMKKIQ